MSRVDLFSGGRLETSSNYLDRWPFVTTHASHSAWAKSINAALSEHSDKSSSWTVRVDESGVSAHDELDGLRRERRPTSCRLGSSVLRRPSRFRFVLTLRLR